MYRYVRSLCLSRCSRPAVVFGIIAVVKASKANSLYQQQMYEEAEAQNSTAKTMTIIAFVFGGIGTLMFNILFGLDLSRIL